MIDSPKKAGFVAWMMLTGAAIAPAAAQSADGMVAQEPEVTLERAPADPREELSEGSGSDAPAVDARRRNREQEAKSIQRRHRESDNKVAPQ